MLNLDKIRQNNEDIKKRMLGDDLEADLMDQQSPIDILEGHPNSSAHI